MSLSRSRAVMLCFCIASAVSSMGISDCTWVSMNPPNTKHFEQAGCTDVSKEPQVQAGLTPSNVTGAYVVMCPDSFFDNGGIFGGYCEYGPNGEIAIRRISPQYQCQCAFHEGFHIGNYPYTTPEEFNSNMVETCKEFSLTPPENPSWVGV
jgi:hypothetical protein